MINLIFVFETSSQNKSDFMYVKSAIDHFYGSRSFHINPVYACGKGNLTKKEKEIKAKFINHGNFDSESIENIVVICADFDRVDDPLNKVIENYCKEHPYELVWMNLDIEDVFLKRQIKDQKKKKEVEDFMKKKGEKSFSDLNLNDKNLLAMRHSTNLLMVLDKYLKRK